MMLLTKANRRALKPLRSRAPMAVVKFFMPDGHLTWYAAEFDGKDTFYGVTTGVYTEKGYFSLSEITALRGKLGLPVERDRYFRPTPLDDL
jgi:hypothetical protein